MLSTERNDQMNYWHRARMKTVEGNAVEQIEPVVLDGDREIW